MVEGLKHFVRAQAQMKAQIIRAATLAFVVLPIGCASIVSLSASPDNPKHQCRRPQDVYGGTQLDYTGLCRRSGDGLFQHGPLALIVDIGDMAQRLVIAVDLPMKAEDQCPGLSYGCLCNLMLPLKSCLAGKHGSSNRCHKLINMA